MQQIGSCRDDTQIALADEQERGWGDEGGDDRGISLGRSAARIVWARVGRPEHEYPFGLGDVLQELGGEPRQSPVRAVDDSLVCHIVAFEHMPVELVVAVPQHSMAGWLAPQFDAGADVLEALAQHPRQYAVVGAAPAQEVERFSAICALSKAELAVIPEAAKPQHQIPII